MTNHYIRNPALCLTFGAVATMLTAVCIAICPIEGINENEGDWISNSLFPNSTQKPMVKSRVHNEMVGWQHSFYAQTYSIFIVSLNELPENPSVVYRIREFGWPFRCMYTIETYDERGRYGLIADEIGRVPPVRSLTGGIPLRGIKRTDDSSRFGDLYGVVPYRVIPLGFVINIIIYSAAPASVLLILSRRRRRRIDNGFCENCGYNIKINEAPACPECGLLVSRKGHG